MPPRDVLLAIGAHHIIDEPNVEAAYDRIVALAGSGVSYDTVREAVAACVRDGLIREPIRLPEGALHCHWRLELTPAGVARAGALLRADPDRGTAEGIDRRCERAPAVAHDRT